jgi:phosphatidylserine decarboxylase
MKIAPEGIPFIGFFFVLTGIVFFALGTRYSVYWAIVPLVLTLFMVYFFRDPERIAPPEAGYLSPADGKVLLVEEPVDDMVFLKRDVKMLSIFMSPLDVHVNRAPCAGTVRLVKHKPGSFKAAYHREAPWKNESTSMILACDSGHEILVRQVAGALARRTVCRVAPGDKLRRGERYGMIKFSSRLDVYLPLEAEVLVEIGQMVKAGQTILARAPGEGR